MSEQLLIETDTKMNKTIDALKKLTLQLEQERLQIH